ncbi:unnamed protein product [Acanthoscelides obtectus]|uniref:Uncharacterized protein n=1 Tax=Acanthoscelides obtectus TaxID=200917 RepID=A0A9P0LJZ2_ACAOB|nr:unnamed protein product [Acanthoscelides obtectus]CAK1624127.1 hypothetical protein AOBTE_LOCUS2337 [Acanthoscelides obtectus]
MVSSNEKTPNIEKLVDNESSEMWRFQINIVFKSQGLWEIVNGIKIIDKSATAEHRTCWEKKYAKAQKYIITTVDKKILLHVMSCKTSAEMYKKLCSIFQKDTEDKKCALLCEFFNLTYQKEYDLSLHISKI